MKILIMGLPGSGKTTLASKLVPLSGCNLSQKIRSAIWSFDLIAQPKNESSELQAAFTILKQN